MKTVEQVRRERLLLLLNEEGVGTLVAINKALDLDARDSTLSQIKNQSKSSHNAEPKVMGSKMARQIERAFKKPEGWMDTDPDLEWPFMTISPQTFRQLDDRLKGIVEAAARDALRDLSRAGAVDSPGQASGTEPATRFGTPTATAGKPRRAA